MLARWLSLLENCPEHQKVAGSTPGQDTYLGSIPSQGMLTCKGGNWSMFLSLSLPLSPKSINIILGENLKNKNKKKNSLLWSLSLTLETSKWISPSCLEHWLLNSLVVMLFSLSPRGTHSQWLAPGLNIRQCLFCHSYCQAFCKIRLRLDCNLTQIFA